MSRNNGGHNMMAYGPIPPHIKKHADGRPPNRPNKYANLRPSEQRNTSGQRRVKREEAKRG